MNKIIKTLSAIVTIILGVLWLLGVLFNLSFKDFIEPISFIISGMVWLILNIFFTDKTTHEGQKDPNPSVDKSKSKIKKIFQVNIGSGTNIGGDQTVIEKEKEN